MGKSQSKQDTARPGIDVIAEFHAKPGSEFEIRMLLQALVAPSCEEKGCQDELGEHPPSDARRNGVFYTCEKWIDLV